MSRDIPPGYGTRGMRAARTALMERLLVVVRSILGESKPFSPTGKQEYPYYTVQWERHTRTGTPMGVPSLRVELAPGVMLWCNPWPSGEYYGYNPSIYFTAQRTIKLDDKDYTLPEPPAKTRMLVNLLRTALRAEKTVKL